MTAMQELIQEIESSQQRFITLAKADKKFSKGVDAILTATTVLKIKAVKLLKKEKEQIIEAYCEAEDKSEFFEYEHRYGREYLTAEDYYTNTFNTK